MSLEELSDFSFETKVCILYEIVENLANLHTSGFRVGDLTTENIFLDKSKILKGKFRGFKVILANTMNVSLMSSPSLYGFTTNNAPYEFLNKGYWH